MANTFTITLDGAVYTLHRFNIGELEEVTEISTTMAPAKAGFAILKLAMRRAVPLVPDPNSIEATNEELTTALTAIMEAAGMAQPSSGEAKPATGAT